MIVASFVDLFILLLQGDRVAWIWVAAMALLVIPILIIWWRVSRMFKREEEEKKRKRGKKMSGDLHESAKCEEPWTQSSN